MSVERARESLDPTRLNPWEARRFGALCDAVQRALQERFPREALTEINARRKAEWVVQMRRDCYALWRLGVGQTQRKTPADLAFGFTIRPGPAEQSEDFEILRDPRSEAR